MEDDDIRIRLRDALEASLVIPEEARHDEEQCNDAFRPSTPYEERDGTQAEDHQKATKEFGVGFEPVDLRRGGRPLRREDSRDQTNEFNARFSVKSSMPALMRVAHWYALPSS